MTFKTERARDTTAGAFAATMNFGGDRFYLSSADFEKPKQSYSKGERYVIRYLLTNEVASVKDISEAADTCAPTTARNCIYALADKGLLARTNGGGKGSGATYSLTEAGRQLAEGE